MACVYLPRVNTHKFHVVICVAGTEHSLNPWSEEGKEEEKEEEDVTEILVVYENTGSSILTTL